MVKSDSAAFRDCESVRGSSFKLIKTLLGPKSWIKLFGFFSHSLDQNALLHAGAAGHRTDLRLDTTHFGREEICEHSSECRNPW